MNAFHQLWLNKKEASKRERQFAHVVRDSTLTLWRPGQSIEPRGVRTLVGVATYSEYDMRLLDLLDQRDADSASSPPLRIDVFSLHECKSPDDIDLYLPKIGAEVVTPVIGVWKDQQLVETGAGAVAREKMLIEPFKLDWSGQTWCWQIVGSN